MRKKLLNQRAQKSLPSYCEMSWWSRLLMLSMYALFLHALMGCSILRALWADCPPSIGGWKWDGRLGKRLGDWWRRSLSLISHQDSHQSMYSERQLRYCWWSFSSCLQAFIWITSDERIRNCSHVRILFVLALLLPSLMLKICGVRTAMR